LKKVKFFFILEIEEYVDEDGNPVDKDGNPIIKNEEGTKNIVKGKRFK
jgi:hypothetical protein